MKQMPILGDLHKHLQENPMTQRLAAIISRLSPAAPKASTDRPM